ncbi:MAG: DUF1385 domain-containing protein [Lachnospiraceae bacterium]|nr:DUF1385 domain-containing protein [Lachnospiraceae bacterium]
MAGKKQHYSGIGGQAVLEGVMMKNGSSYAVTVRKPDGQAEVMKDVHHGLMEDSVLIKIPFVRGIFMFIDSLMLGMKSLNYSASFYDEEEADEKGKKSGAGDKLLTAIVTVVAFALAIFLFMLLPYFIAQFLDRFIRSRVVMTLIEGGVRILIFLLYVSSISMMKDIKRLYMYHGAEHKCINCIESGKELNVDNVRDSSRFHRRCGTSFILLVLLISVILFFFITVTNPLLRVLIRIALIPVISGTSYELIRLAGRSDSFLVKIISAPGFLMQKITTKEPDDAMIEVAIDSVEAVFDWKEYLEREFGL